METTQSHPLTTFTCPSALSVATASSFTVPVAASVSLTSPTNAASTVLTHSVSSLPSFTLAPPLPSSSGTVVETFVSQSVTCDNVLEGNTTIDGSSPNVMPQGLAETTAESLPYLTSDSMLLAANLEILLSQCEPQQSYTSDESCVSPARTSPSVVELLLSQQTVEATSPVISSLESCIETDAEQRHCNDSHF